MLLIVILLMSIITNTLSGSYNKAAKFSVLSAALLNNGNSFLPSLIKTRKLGRSNSFILKDKDKKFEAPYLEFLDKMEFKKDLEEDDVKFEEFMKKNPTLFNDMDAFFNKLKSNTKFEGEDVEEFMRFLDVLDGQDEAEALKYNDDIEP